MNESLRKFVVAGASDISHAERCSPSCVQLIYRINEKGTLQRAQLFSPSKKSIMGIYDNGGLKNSDIDKLIKDILTEYMRRNYIGILLDLTDSIDTIAQVQTICSVLSSKRILHFIPVSMAGLSKDAKLIIPSSICGGSLRDIISSYISKYQPSRLCLEIIRNRNDFTMPSYKPEGEFLSLERYKKLLEKHSPSSFFSEELACKYFTYRTLECTHFVLYDDPETAIYKINLAESYDFYAAFILYSEWGENTKAIINAK